MLERVLVLGKAKEEVDADAVPANANESVLAFGAWLTVGASVWWLCTLSPTHDFQKNIWPTRGCLSATATDNER